MAKLVSTDPSKNFEKIGEVDVSTKAKVREAVKNARYASIKWRKLEVKKRLEYLKNVYIAISKRKNEISTLASREMGFPIRDQKMFDIGDGLNYFKWYLKNADKLLSPEVTFEDKDEIHKVYFEPYGVAAVIQPWNFPFCQWSWSVVPNLLAGNTVVFKHSEECPLTGKLIEEIIKTTKLPRGVFNEVYGDGKVGEELLQEDIDLITFTGSVKVGMKVYRLAADKFIKVVLELGGSAPGVVFADADIDRSVEDIFALRFTNAGQACDGLKRLIVHKSIFKEVVEKLTEIVESKSIGNPLDTKTDFGPLVAKRQQKLLLSQVRDAKTKGAKVIIGGKMPSDLKGAYFEPTILINIKKSMRVWKEEVFGPVLPIISFNTEEEAIQLANDTELGLGGYVFTQNIKRAERVAKALQTGMVSVNGANYVVPWNPFGGYKHSGLGREHGRFGLHDVSQIKVVVLPK